MREKKNGHRAHCYWLTGLSGSGKSTIAKGLSEKLHAEGRQVHVLDGDNLRHALNSDLGFSREDREENIRRIGHVARLFFDAGFIVICAFFSPHQKMRDRVRALFPQEATFTEAYVKCSLEECRRRDPKGLYQPAEQGKILDLTGVGREYEEPESPELVFHTARLTLKKTLTLLALPLTGEAPPG